MKYPFKGAIGSILGTSKGLPDHDFDCAYNSILRTELFQEKISKSRYIQMPFTTTFMFFGTL